MIPNPNEIDKNGHKIKEGDTIRMYQFAQSAFVHDMKFDSQEEADKFAELFSFNEKEGAVCEFKPFGDEYRYYVDGIPFALEIQEIISEKSVFSIPSERDIPEIGVKRGDQVLVIGGEGYAAGICRYEPYTLEIIKKAR